MTPESMPDTPLETYVLRPIGYVVYAVFVLGIPLDALYLLVRFVKWAWLQ